jgi:hypothetical protein
MSDPERGETMRPKFKALAGVTVATSFSSRGHATLTGAGIATLTVEPLTFEEAEYRLFPGPEWPQLYAWNEQEARALATAYSATYEPAERLVPVHWRLVRSDGDLLFADWGDLALYARHMYVLATERTAEADRATATEEVT